MTNKCNIGKVTVPISVIMPLIGALIRELEHKSW